MEIGKEHKALSKERKDIQALLKDEELRWDRIAAELEETRKKFGVGRAGRARARELGAAPAAVEVSSEAPSSSASRSPSSCPRRAGSAR